MSTTWMVTLIGGLFVVKFLSGVWLTWAGRPYNVALITVHKLISLLAAVLIGILVYRLRRGVGLSPVEIVAVVVTGLLFLAAILSGGLTSVDRPMSAALLIVHRVTPFLTVLSTAATLYLVVWAK